jgi:hypothetical protein
MITREEQSTAIVERKAADLLRNFLQNFGARIVVLVYSAGKKID